MARFDFSPAAINVAESLIQTAFFDSELDANNMRNHPNRLPQPALSERTVMLGAVLRMTGQRSQGVSVKRSAPTLTAQDHQEITRTNASDLRLIGRQLIMIKKLEGYAAARQPQPHMQEAKETGQDVVARLCDFLRTHQPSQADESETAVYDLLRKTGLVYSRTDTHQDHTMAVLLRETGIGKPASPRFPSPLRAVIITPTARDTYRLANTRRGNSVFRTEAPDLRFITTRRYEGLLRDQGGAVVVTNPEFLEEAVLSGRMTTTQFDLVLTDGLSPERATEVHSLVHSQRIGPVVVDFAVGHPHATPTIYEDGAM